MTDDNKTSEPWKNEKHKDADPNPGNIETDTPGSQQSVDDINKAVEALIEEADDEKKKDR